MAFDRPAECHVPDNTAPSRHCRSVLQLVQRGLRYTHAVNKNHASIIIVPELLSFSSEIIDSTAVKFKNQSAQYFFFSFSIQDLVTVVFHRNLSHCFSSLETNKPNS